jgi:hypothetical protein
VLHWCGLPRDVQQQLSDNSDATRMHLEPATAFQGPRFLLSVSA